MKKSCVLQGEGGIGKQIASTALVLELKKRYEKVYVFSPYPDLFWGIADRSFTFEVPYGYQDYFDNADDVFYPSPYRDNEFRKHNINLCKAYFRCCGFEYNGEMPKLILKSAEIELAKKIKKDIGTFVLVQFHGGVSPYNPNQPQSQPKIIKNFPMELAEKLTAKIKEKYKCQVVNFHLPNENGVKGTLEINLPYRQWFALMQEAETFIGIDSTLQHAAAAIGKQGVVLWGGTDPKMYGYEMHKNISGDCETIHCTRPYFVPSSDIVENTVFECPSKKCMNIDVEKIMNEIKISKNILAPTINIDPHICNCKPKGDHPCGT